MTGLVLLPRDGMFLKDGRDWQSAGRAKVYDWPHPSLLRGALRTMSGRAEEGRRGKGAVLKAEEWLKVEVSIGRTLALCRAVEPQKAGAAGWKVEDRRWPVPLDTLFMVGEKDGKAKDNVSLRQLNPVRRMGNMLGRDAKSKTFEAAREGLLWPEVAEKGKPKSRPTWWSDGEFIQWLLTPEKSVKAFEERGVAQLNRTAPVNRLQIHLSVDSTTETAVDGALFAHESTETLVYETQDRLLPKDQPRDLSTDQPRKVTEWAIGLEAELPAGVAPAKTLTFGSDSRLAWLEAMPAGLFAAPQFPSSASGVRLIAVTPALFKGGWLPDGFTAERLEQEGREVFTGEIAGMRLRLEAAFVDRPKEVSGWDMAGGHPKQTMRLVPPGSVYFLRRVDNRPFFKSDMEKLWLCALGQKTEEGLGRFVAGVWEAPAADKTSENKKTSDRSRT